MIYSEKYDRWVSKDGQVFRLNKRNNKLEFCRQSRQNKGYCLVAVKIDGKTKLMLVHRLVWEAFNGDIPAGSQIDHINTVRDDNRLENLRVCSQKENSNNPSTLRHIASARRAKATTWSYFGNKFYEHYGIYPYQNRKLYRDEYHWFTRHGNRQVCQWEA